MDIIDAQLHPSKRPSTRFPWSTTFTAGRAPEELRRFEDTCVSAEDLIRMMDAAGVGSAILVSRAMAYGDDDSYAFDCATRHAGRFMVVTPMAPHTKDVEERIASYRERPFGIGIRVILLPGSEGSFDDPGFRRIFAAAESADVPVFVAPGGKLRPLHAIARDFPRLVMILDHLGLLPGRQPNPFLYLEDVIELARHDNVFMKWSAAPRLSRQPYPFEDIWPQLLVIRNAYTAKRMMWGSDVTQHLGELSYQESLDHVRLARALSDHEKELLLGKTARAVLRWPAPAG